MRREEALARGSYPRFFFLTAGRARFWRVVGWNARVNRHVRRFVAWQRGGRRDEGGGGDAARDGCGTRGRREGLGAASSSHVEAAQGQISDAKTHRPPRAAKPIRKPPRPANAATACSSIEAWKLSKEVRLRSGARHGAEVGDTPCRRVQRGKPPGYQRGNHAPRRGRLRSRAATRA